MGGGNSLQKWPNFQLSELVTLTLTFDWVMLHTVMHHAPTSTYTPNFIEIRRKSFFKSSSSSSRNEYYLGGVMALLLQDHRTCVTMSIKTVKKQFVAASTW